MKQKIVLSAAVVAGLVAAVLTRFYLSAKDSEIADMKAKYAERYGRMEVLCYGEDVPSGTVLTRKLLAKKIVPALGLRGQALTLENLGAAQNLAHEWSDARLSVRPAIHDLRRLSGLLGERAVHLVAALRLIASGAFGRIKPRVEFCRESFVHTRAQSF